MRLLFVAPMGSCFNHTLHYRYTDVGETLGYVAAQRPQDRLAFFDLLASPLEQPFLREVAGGVDAVVFFADVAAAPAALRLARMVRDLDPALPIAVYGKGALRIPAYFCRPPFDAVHASGDQEAALVSWVEYLERGTPPHGLWLASGGAEAAGTRLPVAQWSFPTLDALPLDDYRRLARAKGIPFELSVYPSKGCALRCAYCDASRHEGTALRSREPLELVRWVDLAVRRHDFDCVQLHGADFCADSDWVRRFCHAYRQERCSFAWTACSRTATVSGELLAAMSAAGCIRIGIGVEHLPAAGGRGPKTSLDELRRVAGWLAAARLLGKAYLMAGYPGQTELDLLHTWLACHELGLIPRVSTYTPFDALDGLSAAQLDRLDLTRFDRKSYLPEEAAFRSTILRLAVRAPGLDEWARARRAELLGPTATREAS